MWHLWSFILLGIASLAGWNAIMSTFDFFAMQYPIDYYPNVYFYFGVPIMLSNFIGGLICPALAKIFSLTQRIAFCLLGVCGLMILVTLIALYCNTMLGFVLSLFVLFVQGFIDSINTNSLIALAGMLSPRINSLYWTSTALSGLTMNFIRIAVMSFQKPTPDSPKRAITYFFSVAAIVYIISSTLQIMFTNSNYFKQVL